MFKSGDSVEYSTPPPGVAHVGDEFTKVVPVYTGDEEWLGATVQSVDYQEAGPQVGADGDYIATLVPADGGPPFQINAVFLRPSERK